MKWKSVFILSAEDVRNYCIRHDYYTCGDCEEYDNLLTHLIAGEMTAEKLYGAATDIVKHSDYDPNGFDTEADVIDKVASDLMCLMQILEVSNELLRKLEKQYGERKNA